MGKNTLTSCCSSKVDGCRLLHWTAFASCWPVEDAVVPERSKRRGTIEVVSRLHIADGVELVIEPSRACLTPEQVRELSRGVMALFDAIEARDKTEG